MGIEQTIKDIIRKLEERTHRDVRIEKAEKVTLWRSDDEEGINIMITMPWGNAYCLHQTKNEEESNRKYSEYNKALSNGASIRIVNPYEAAINNIL